MVNASHSGHSSGFIVIIHTLHLPQASFIIVRTTVKLELKHTTHNYGCIHTMIVTVLINHGYCYPINNHELKYVTNKSQIVFPVVLAGVL